MNLLPLLLSCAARDLPELPSWTWVAPEVSAGTLTMAVTGRGRSRARASYTGGGGELLDFVGYAFVHEHPEHGVLVIDPGYPSLAEDPSVYPGRFLANVTGLSEVAPLVGQLSAAGLAAADVDRLLITHGHVDHAGAIADFPGATLHVVEREWDFARKRDPLHAVIPEPYVDHEAVELLTFDGGPYGPFPSHHDLYGDGSVIVLPTPGHTPGHSSVLVNLPESSWLLVGDAAWLERHWAEPTPKGRMTQALLEDDPGAAWLALARIHAWAEANPELRVMAGHEPQLEVRYPTLPASL